MVAEHYVWEKPGFLVSLQILRSSPRFLTSTLYFCDKNEHLICLNCVFRSLNYNQTESLIDTLKLHVTLAMVLQATFLRDYSESTLSLLSFET